MENTEYSKKIPVEMDYATYRSLAGADDYPYVAIMVGSRLTHGILVEATEQQYQAYIRSINCEEKQIERQRKCMVRSEKTNRLVRCTKSCANCEKLKTGAPLSLDALSEELNTEPINNAATSSDCDTALTLLLMKQLLNKLKKQSPELATIFSMLLDEESHQAIADAIGKPRQTTSDIIARLKKQLQKEISREDF